MATSAMSQLVVDIKISIDGNLLSLGGVVVQCDVDDNLKDLWAKKLYEAIAEIVPEKAIEALKDASEQL